jgi:hypothetical protein
MSCDTGTNAHIMTTMNAHSGEESDDELESFLAEAVRAQVRRHPRRARKKPISESEDYSRRLAEKALYRRLINESFIAQDGIRFIFFFSHPSHSEGRSLEDWRRKIDREILADRRRREKMLAAEGEASKALERSEGLAEPIEDRDDGEVG